MGFRLRVMIRNRLALLLVGDAGLFGGLAGVDGGDHAFSSFSVFCIVASALIASTPLPPRPSIVALVSGWEECSEDSYSTILSRWCNGERYVQGFICGEGLRKLVMPSDHV